MKNIFLLLALTALTAAAGEFPLHEARLQALIPAGDTREYLLAIDPELPPQGYRIDPGDSAVRISGGDLRGLYYGINALAGGVRAVSAAPEWLCRYAGDYNSLKYEHYLQLADRGVSGFAWQWRREWQDFRPDAPSDYQQLGTLQDSLDEIRRAHDTGLVDFMLVMHIYAVSGNRTTPWFDCSNPGDIAALTERCRLAAGHGIRHIMICTDDWTPRENGRYVAPNAGERDCFDDSVGRAHGYLMSRLYENLHAEFPQLELSLVPPVYSVDDHHSGDPDGAVYLRDFDRAAPPEVYLAWTGPSVISDRIGRDDHRRFTRELTSGRKLVFWDNSECFDPPLPVWQTEFYPGAAADHDGIIFLNAHAFGWSWTPFYIDDANDYLWDAASYDWRERWRSHVAAAFGDAAAERLLAWRDRLMVLRRAAAAGAQAQQRLLLADLETRLEALRPTPNLGLRELESALTAVRDRLDITVREIELPLLEDAADFPDRAAVFELVRNDGGGDAPELSTRVEAAFAGDALRLHLVCAQPDLDAIARPVVMKERDDAVYNHPEAVELFIQPGAATGYGHFVFDPWGNRFDAEGANGPDGWDPDWQVKTARNDGGWEAAVTIPVVEFEKLGLTRPAPGVIWRFNLLRSVYGREPSAFAPTRHYGYHTPEFFGALKMHR